VEAAGCLTLVEDHNSFAVHNSATDLPIDKEEVPESRVRKLKSEVPMADGFDTYHLCFEGAKAPDTNKESSPKRKRCDPRPSVSFEPEVKVCVSRDIDVLRKDVSILLIATDEPLRRMLRAAADQNVANTAQAHSSGGVTTKRPSETIALKLEDSKETVRPQWLFSRNCSAYRPGAWSPSSGSEIVDTSGKHMSEEEFESYNRILDIEAEHLDTAEELEANKFDLSAC
jgi:hypothetical protein